MRPIDKDAMAESLAPLRALFTKSVVAREPLAAGTVLRSEHLAAKKPGSGIPAERLPEIVGRTLKRAIAADTLLSEADFE
jgi:N-acetylneuraminate synthase